jgi:ParB-like chromosome segregation protein Spo0J
MEILEVNINELKPSEYNPRKLTEKEAKDLENSLKKFNLADIPVINLDNRIISGHQRIAILEN